MTTGEYNQCVDMHSDGVYRFLMKNTKDTHLASDLVQESFLKLWLKRKDVDFEKGKSYLFTTAYHTMIDYFRKNKRIVTLENHNISKHSLENEFTDIKEVLEKAVEKLPDVQRSVLLLRDYEGYSYEEIGEMTGLSESQVKVYIYRARLFMKSYIVNPEYVV